MLSFARSRRYLRRAAAWYRNHGESLPTEQAEEFETLIEGLQSAIEHGDRPEASALAQQLQSQFPPSIKSNTKRTSVLIALAIVLVLTGLFIARQSWFEMYQIPTGSMRPTFREGDHIFVSKTVFGLNRPFQSGHAYFDPALVKRTSLVVWSSEGLELPDTSTPKRYVKRLLGKPGDTLYFYGGSIYGIDKDGRDISREFDVPWMQPLEFVPFTSFEGHITTAAEEDSNLVHQIFLNQMARPIGRLTLKGYGVLEGDINVNGRWFEDNDTAAKTEHDSVETYTDFWGMRNYAMARLLTRDQVRQLTDINPETLENAILYLELRHSPSLTTPKPRFQEGPDGRIRLMLTPHVTVIPLQDRHLVRLMDSMYTSRFIVQDGRAALYGVDGGSLTPSSPMLTKVPDGVYEFYHGKAYSIDWKGSLHELERTHPLYLKAPSNIQRLFNLGMDFDADYAPTKPNQVDFPSRYAYFRDGDLYVLGSPIVRRGEPTLQHYVEHELERQRHAPRKRPYVAFVDHGSPVKEGRLDRRFIRAFGVQIPDGHYLMLGDNHARSADSRYFGFVPEQSLLGSPSYIFWPPGGRPGEPAQPELPWATLPRAMVWGMVWLIAASAYFAWIRNRKKTQRRGDAEVGTQRGLGKI